MYESFPVDLLLAMSGGWGHTFLLCPSFLVTFGDETKMSLQGISVDVFLNWPGRRLLTNEDSFTLMNLWEGRYQ